MTPPTTARAGMTAPIVVAAITLLLGIQAVATDLYLPALPTIATALGASVSAAQLTLSALVIAFGLSQLVCGPLSDRFGRRPVVLTGLAVYVLASIGSTLAPDIEWLIALRAVQGAATAAAVTCGRSVIRDLFEPHEGARVMARALTGLGGLAIAAPIVGSLTVAFIHWRASLAATAVFGMAALAFCALRFEETVAIKNPAATQPGPLWRTWRHIASHPTFLAYALVGAGSYVGLFLILVGSSFVYINIFGISRLEYGALMTGNALSYTLGTVLCRRLLARRGVRATVMTAAWISLLSGLALLGVALADLHSVLLFAAPHCVFAAAHGIHQPCSQAGAIGPFPRMAGTAAALSGFLMMLAAFIVGLVYGKSVGGTVMPLAIGICAAGVAVAATAWTLVRQHGEMRVVPDVVPEPA